MDGRGVSGNFVHFHLLLKKKLSAFYFFGQIFDQVLQGHGHFFILETFALPRKGPRSPLDCRVFLNGTPHWESKKRGHIKQIPSRARPRSNPRSPLGGHEYYED